MNATLKATLDMVREISIRSDVKASRGYTDVLSDRIVQSGTQSSLLAFAERLAELMQMATSNVFKDSFHNFMLVAHNPDSRAVLNWLRQYPKVAAMLCMLKHEVYAAAIDSIVIEDLDTSGQAPKQGQYNIPITITCLSPLSHGSDTKAGNATLYRRINVLSETGGMLSLPIYGGNAIRGAMRDLLAEHLLISLGMAPRRDNPPVELWFFHALFSGGCLEENSKSAKAIGKEMGANGSVKCRGITRFRDMLPCLSVLGTALGNRIISGRVSVSDFRPSCFQWNNGTADVAEIFDWVYLTRREDYEGWGGDEEEKHTGMIANTEVLKAGVTLSGGLIVSDHSTDIERACIGKGVQLLQQRGQLGAQNSRGLGRVEIACGNAPDATPYDTYLESHADEIRQYLTELGALQCTPATSLPDTLTP